MVGFRVESNQCLGNWYSQLPCFTLSIKRNSVENKPACLVVVPMGKALSGILPSKRARQMAGNS